MTKARWPVVFLALILTTLATSGLCTYSRSPLDTGPPMVFVVVSKVDIPARTDLNELVKDDQFKIVYVPESVVLDGPVTSIDQLRDGYNRVVILAGEQIPVARIKAYELDGSGCCGMGR